MYKVLTDVYLSRQQRMCHVVDELDTLRWSGKHVADALHYLIENDHIEVRLEGENHAFMISIAPMQE